MVVFQEPILLKNKRMFLIAPKNLFYMPELPNL